MYVQFVVNLMPSIPIIQAINQRVLIVEGKITILVGKRLNVLFAKNHINSTHIMQVINLLVENVVLEQEGNYIGRGLITLVVSFNEGVVLFVLKENVNE